MMKNSLMVVFALAIASGAFATTWTDSGADSLWENAANWDTVVPTGAEVATIDDGDKLSDSLVIGSVQFEINIPEQDSSPNLV